LMIFYHIEKCPDQLVVFYKQHVIHILLYVRQDLISDSLHSSSVGNRIGAVQFHHFACRRAAVILAASAGSTPITLILGFSILARVDTPEINPPPPTGTRI